LIEGIDVAAIEAKITKYEQENVEQIINARARKACKRFYEAIPCLHIYLMNLHFFVWMFAVSWPF